MVESGDGIGNLNGDVEKQILQLNEYGRISAHSVYGKNLLAKGVFTTPPYNFVNGVEHVQVLRGNHPIVDSDHIDEKTGVPLEEPILRDRADRSLAESIVQASETGKKSAAIFADGDLLKVANDKHGEDFGDDMIRAGASMLTRMLAPYQGEGIQMYAMRKPTGGADEIKVVVTGLSEDDLARLKSDVKKLSQRKTHIELSQEGQDIDYTLSSSVGIVTSDDVAVQSIAETEMNKIRIRKGEDAGQIDEAKVHLANKEIFDQVLSLAEEKAMMVKMAKDIGRLDLEELGRADWIEGVKEVLFDEVANSRVSKALETTQLEIFDIILNLSDMNPTDLQRHLRTELDSFASASGSLFPEADHLTIYLDTVMQEIYANINRLPEGDRRDNFTNFDQQLEAQGISLTPDSDILAKIEPRDKTLPQYNWDEKTGFAEETLNMKDDLYKEFEEAILDEDHVFIVGMTDGDQLKAANTVDHLFGDAVIQAGAVSYQEIFGGLQLSPDAKVWLLRQSGGADEIVTVVTGVSPDEAEEVQRKINEYAHTRTKVKVRNQYGEQSFTISSSSGSVSSLDWSIQSDVRTARETLQDTFADHSDVAEGLYKKMKSIANKTVKLVKEEKDRLRLDPYDFARTEDLADVKRILIEEIGGTRISDKLQQTQLEVFQHMRRLLQRVGDVEAQETYMWDQLLYMDNSLTRQRLDQLRDELSARFEDREPLTEIQAHIALFCDVIIRSVYDGTYNPKYATSGNTS